MVIFEKSSRHSLIPSFLYSSSISPKSLALVKMLKASPSAISSNVDASASMKNILIPAPVEPSKKIEMNSPAFYAACTTGGILSCSLTHMTVTPLDLFKCNMQGACKFGFYEFFKKYYSDIVGPEFATKYKTLIYLAGSASAEVLNLDIDLHCWFDPWFELNLTCRWHR